MGLRPLEHIYGSFVAVSAVERRGESSVLALPRLVALGLGLESGRRFT